MCFVLKWYGRSDGLPENAYLHAINRKKAILLMSLGSFHCLCQRPRGYLADWETLNAGPTYNLPPLYPERLVLPLLIRGNWSQGLDYNEKPKMDASLCGKACLHRTLKLSTVL